jgi:hypothetical protein
MTTAPNFASILDESPTEVIYPAPPPVGTYLCIVQAPKYPDPDADMEAVPFVRFPLKPIQALDDVDDKDLAEYGGVANASPFDLSFWANSPHQLDKFHTDCGIDLSEPATRRDRNDAIINAEVLVSIGHRPDRRDPKRVFAMVKGTASVE